MRRAIFLDIDGVLNTPMTTERTPDGFRGIEDKYIINLEKLVSISDADIVLTSDWKDSWDINPDKCDVDGKYLNARLAEFGLHIKDKTSDRARGTDISGRGMGIRAYLLDNRDIKRYVIIDDNFFEDFDSGLQKHFVNVPSYLGFTEEYFTQAKNILLREDWEPEHSIRV